MAVGSGVVTTRTWSAQRVKLKTLGLMPAPVSIRMTSRLGFQFGQGVDEALAVEIAQVGHAGQARSAADQAKPAGAVNHDVRQLALCAPMTCERLDGRSMLHSTSALARPRSASMQHDALAGRRQLDRQIDGDIALADAALAAGDGDDGRGGNPSPARANPWPARASPLPARAGPSPRGWFVVRFAAVALPGRS